MNGIDVACIYDCGGNCKYKAKTISLKMRSDIERECGRGRRIGKKAACLFHRWKERNMTI